MNALSQRLKELDSDTFQKLCFQVLKERYPGADIRYVDGMAGDEGLDLFSGRLEGRPVIWQCKAFPNGIGKSQKQQIHKSLARALDRFSPKRWVLCIPVDMDSKAHRWFQGLERSHRDVVQIGLFVASDLVNELIHRRSIRNHFFPGAAIDVDELKRALTNTGELSSRDLESLTEANAEAFIERLKERDARFNYEVVFNTDLGVNHSEPKSAPGMILSIADGKKTINVYSRDHEALEADPPQISFTLKGNGISKFASLIKRGIPQEFISSELQDFVTDFRLIEPQEIRDHRLIVKPRLENAKSLKAEVRLGSGADAVEYRLLEFVAIRVGTDEAEFVTAGDLPFRLRIVLPFKNLGPANWKFKKQFAGRKIRQIGKFLRALAAIRLDGNVSLYDLASEQIILRGHLSMPAETEHERAVAELIANLLAVENRFGLDLTLPGEITDQDFEALTLLITYMEGGSSKLGNITVRLIKSVDNQHSVPELLQKPGALCLKHENPQVVLFGTTVNIGPATMIADSNKVSNLTETLSAFAAAAIGEAVDIVFEPLTPVRFGLVNASQDMRVRSS